MRAIYSYVIFVSILLNYSCRSSKPIESNIGECKIHKITFNMDIFDARGLIGEENQKTGLDYEFCIPNKLEHLNEIREIDASIKQVKGFGRTRCSVDFIILTGNSYNKDIKIILCKLSNLDYVTEINQVFWE